MQGNSLAVFLWLSSNSQNFLHTNVLALANDLVDSQSLTIICYCSMETKNHPSSSSVPTTYVLQASQRPLSET